MVVLLSLCWFSHNKVSRVVLFLPNTEIAIPCSLQYECLDFPGGPVVKTLHFQCGGVGRRGVGSVPDWGAKIPHASQRDQKKKKKECLLFHHPTEMNIEGKLLNLCHF